MKKKIVIFRLLNSFTLAHALLFLIYLKDINIDIFHIGVLFSITYISNLLTELPFGYFADTKSKKLSFYIGSFFTILSLLIFIIYKEFSLIIIASILYGIGMSGKSGSAEAVLINNFDKEFQKLYFEIGNKINLYTNAFMAIFIGYLYKLDMSLPFYISLISELLLLIFVIGIKESKYTVNKSLLKTTVMNNTIKSVLKNYDIYIFLALMYLVIPQLSVYLPAYLKEHISIEYIGILIFLFNIIPILGSKIYDIKLSNLENKKLLYITLVYMTILLFMMSISNFTFFLLLYGLSRIANGWIFMVISKMINNISNNENRATMLSIKSTVMSLMFIFSDPLFGYIISQHNIKFSYFISGLVILSGIVIIMFSRRNVNV
ncbi:MFS transporter [Macrococcoides caseolyticum]|nr:MFS transporter [Macrococcus caseolyticus]RKO13993.1 MFS transporter [Macrococcus caseolyticus]